MAVLLVVAACRTADAPNLTGTWVGTATPAMGDYLPGGADVVAELSESGGGAYFGSVTFTSDDGEQVFDVGAQLPGNRMELEGKDLDKVLELGVLLDVKSDQNSMDGTWTMSEIDCATCPLGSGSIGLQR